MNKKYKPWILGVILFLLLFLTYFESLGNGIVWDDHVYMPQQKTSNLEGLKQIWIDPSFTDHPYYPLTHTSFWLEFKIWQNNPLGYHIVNVILHFLNAFFIWLILRYFGVPWAWLCAAIFALHPVQVESVAWISERKNVLSGAFYFASMYAFFKFYAPNVTLFNEHKPKRWGLYSLSIFLFLCAMLSKTAFCTLPLSLFILIWWKKRKIQETDFRLLIPYFIVAFLLGILTVVLEWNHVGAKGEEWNFTLWERCLIAGRALWFYAQKAIWPADIMFIYPRWDIDASIWWQNLFPITAGITILLLWFFRRKIGRGPLVAVLFFVFNVLPALGFINFYMQIFSFVGDHLQYISILGIIVLAVSIIYRLCRQFKLNLKVAHLILSFVILGWFTIQSWQQSKIYADELTFYSSIVETNPKSWMAYNNRGRIYEEQGFLDLALADYLEAIKTNPNCVDSEYQNLNCMRAFNNVGSIHLKKNQMEEAKTAIEYALDINPGFSKALLNRGALYFKQKEYELALKDFNAAVQSDPYYAKGYMNRGTLHLAQQQYQLAVEDFNRAIFHNPEYDKAYVNRGAIYQQMKMLKQAQADFDKAIEINENYARAYYNRSLNHISLNELEPALLDALKARYLGAFVEDEYLNQIREAIALQKSNNLQNN